MIYLTLGALALFRERKQRRAEADKAEQKSIELFDFTPLESMSDGMPSTLADNATIANTRPPSYVNTTSSGSRYSRDVESMEKPPVREEYHSPL